jgi:hypothetical protein
MRFLFVIARVVFVHAVALFAAVFAAQWLLGSRDWVSLGLSALSKPERYGWSLLAIYGFWIVLLVVVYPVYRWILLSRKVSLSRRERVGVRARGAPRSSRSRVTCSLRSSVSLRHPQDEARRYFPNARYAGSDVGSKLTLLASGCEAKRAITISAFGST